MSTAEFTEADRSEALYILDRFQQIVDNEALVRGSYVTRVVAPERSRQVCGGRNACAIGSLWLAGGITPVYRPAEEPLIGHWRLPGTLGMRDEFLESRPALRLAYGTLNQAAVVYAEIEGIALCGSYEGELENLFEASEREDGSLIDPSELTQVIAIARGLIDDPEPVA